MTGGSGANPVLMPTVLPSLDRIVGPTGPSSSALRSRVDPLEIANQPVYPRVLQVSKEDIDALAQVIKEAHEQFVS